LTSSVYVISLVVSFYLLVLFSEFCISPSIDPRNTAFFSFSSLN
jgi:hypothetical protein